VVSAVRAASINRAAPASLAAAAVTAVSEDPVVDQGAAPAQVAGPAAVQVAGLVGESLQGADVADGLYGTLAAAGTYRFPIYGRYPHLEADDVERKAISIMKACELVGVSRRTIYNWISAGKVDYVRTAGGSVRIFVDSLWRDPQLSEQTFEMPFSMAAEAHK
jgi:excisionase family DNA binding protein